MLNITLNAARVFELGNNKFCRKSVELKLPYPAGR